MIANDPQVLALFRGEPRGFSETHGNVFEPRGGVSYAVNEKTVLRASGGIFHNRVTLNDSTLLGGNPPFQPQATVANGSVDNPGGAAGGVNAAADLPIGINGQDPVFKHPTSYMWSTGVQREIPFGFIVDVSYVGRRGLYLQRERNINQLPLGTLFRPENPGVNIAALRPYTGYGVIRISENSGSSLYNSLQVSADRRYTNGLKVGAAYTLSKSTDNGSDKRNVLWNTYDDTIYEGPSNFDRRHVLNFYYIYDLPFLREQDTLVKNLLGGWQISGATFMRSGTPFTVGQTAQDIAGVGDAGFGQPWSQTANASVNYELYDGTPVRWRSTRASSSGPPTARSATRRATRTTTRARCSGTSRCSRTSTWAARARAAPRRSVQLPEPPQPGRHRSEPAERQLRAHHEQGRPARHPAERAVPVLGRLPGTAYRPPETAYRLPTTAGSPTGGAGRCHLLMRHAS